MTISNNNPSQKIDSNNCKISFSGLCKIFESISKTTKRLEIQEMLSKYFLENMKKDDQNFYVVLYLCTGKVYPDFKNLELGFGDSLIQSCVSEATGLLPKTVKEKFVKVGDFGEIAMAHRVRQLFISKKQLTCLEVLNGLRSLCHQQGSHSTKARKNILLGLINFLSPLETKYLIRLAEGKLKIGLAEATVLIALSISLGIQSSSIKEAYNKNPDFENLMCLINTHGADDFLSYAKIRPGAPLKPMLAAPISNVSMVYKKFENSQVLAEYKYDGERIQIHNLGGDVIDSRNKKVKTNLLPEIEDEITSHIVNIKMFSRNGEDSTNKFKEVTELSFPKEPFIIDGEVVAFKDGKIQPFQLLSTRKRKNVDVNAIEVTVCIFIFDILYFDGEELINRPLSERREILHKYFNEIPDKLTFATYIESSNVETIEEFFKQSMNDNVEGLMLKDLGSPYLPSFRSNKWVKLKKDYVDNLGDSLDLVIIGAYYGKGKRTGKFGGFLLGVYDEEEGVYEACCKIGSGFTDEDLQNFYNKLVITADRSMIISNIEPDVWTIPEYVCEVKAASLSLSPVYTPGNYNGKGISLRFPRFIKERSDKGSIDASTVQQLVDMFNNVSSSMPSKDNNDEEIESDEFN